MLDRKLEARRDLLILLGDRRGTFLSFCAGLVFLPRGGRSTAGVELGWRGCALGGGLGVRVGLKGVEGLDGGDRGRGVRIVRTMVDGDVCLAALVLEIYLMPQGYECRT